MGLLDDAIREHLELKRKHGANPEDVARQEQEALGPGQRNEFAQPEGAAQAPPEPRRARRPSRSRQRRRSRRRGPGAVDELPEGEPGIPRSRRGPGAGLRRGPVARRRARRGPGRRGAPGAPAPPAPPTARRRTCSRRRPDFLQETPEHDRLWFEQKPPRDFDWDK